MNRRTITAAALAAALGATATACASSGDQNAARTAAVNSQFATRSNTSAPAGTCKPVFPGGSGITVNHGTLTATVTVTCDPAITLGVPGIDTGVALSLTRSTQQSGTQQAMTSPQVDIGDNHTVTADCAGDHTAATWRLVAVITGNYRGGAGLALDAMGTAVTLTAADCG